MQDTHLDTAGKSPLHFQSTAIWETGHGQSYPQKLCLGIQTNKHHWQLLGLEGKKKRQRESGVVTNQTETEPGWHCIAGVDQHEATLQKAEKTVTLPGNSIHQGVPILGALPAGREPSGWLLTWKAHPFICNFQSRVAHSSQGSKERPS